MYWTSSKICKSNSDQKSIQKVSRKYLVTEKRCRCSKTFLANDSHWVVEEVFGKVKQERNCLMYLESYECDVPKDNGYVLFVNKVRFLLLKSVKMKSCIRYHFLTTAINIFFNLFALFLMIYIYTIIHYIEFLGFHNCYIYK